MTVQRFLLDRLLNPIGSLSRKLRPKTRDSLFLAGLLLIFLQFFLHASGLFSYRYLISFSVGCIGTAVMFFSLLTGDLKPVRFRPLPMILFLAFGGTILLSGLLNKFDFLSEAILILLVYPIYYIISRGHTPSHIFGLLIRGCELSFIVFIAISAALFPASAARYGGLFSNVNMAAFYLQIVCLAFILDFIYTDKFSFRLILKILLGAAGTALLFYTNSRTGMLAFLVAFLFSVSLYIIPRRPRLDKAFLLKMFLYLLLVAFFIAFILQIFYFVNGLVLQLNRLVIDLVHPSQQNITDPEERDLLDVQSFIARAMEKSQISGKNLDAVSTHRFTIWNKYLAALNFLGHDAPITNTVDYGYMAITSHTAHMTILQIAYDYGIHAGLIYLAFNVFTGLASIRYAIRCHRSRYACFPAAVTLLFGVTSLLASLTVSFNYMILFYYYLVQFPLMTAHETK